MSEPKLGSGTEIPIGKRESAVERAENPSVLECLDYLQNQYGCSDGESAEAMLFLKAHPAQAADFALLIRQCRTQDKLQELGNCDIFPFRSTTVAELRRKEEFH